MSFAAGAVTSVLQLDANPYRQGFIQAQALMQTFPSMVTNFMASPMLGLVGIAQTAMTGLASAIRSGISTVVDIFNESLDQADKIGDLAASVGVGVESLSGLGLIADQAGASVEAVAEAFKFLGRNMAEARQSPNGNIGQTFQQLGIDVNNVADGAAGLESVLFRVADAMAETSDSGRRTQIAMDLLGRGSGNLVGTLSAGSGALREQISVFKDYGAVVTEKAAASADAFDKMFGEFKAAWTGIKNSLAEPLRDYLLPLFQGWLQWIRGHQQEVREFMRGIAKSIAEMVQSAVNNLERLKNAMVGAGIGAVAGGIGGGVIGGFAAGPAGIIPGAMMGARVGTPIGAVGGYYGGSVSKININYDPSVKSDSQLGRELRETFEGAHRSRIDDQTRQLERARIEAGY